MTRRAVGSALRMLGPLIQVVCLAILFGGSPASDRARAALTIVFLLGFALVIIGIGLSRPPSRRVPGPRIDLSDSGPGDEPRS
jgi:hypothetical protein